MSAAPLRPAELLLAVRTHALSLPGAWEDYPWGERVVKVGKKVFVFLGHDAETHAGFSVKLAASGPALLASGLARPTGYGLGKAGWVSVTLTADGPAPPISDVLSWVEESFRAVAPRRTVTAWERSRA